MCFGGSQPKLAPPIPIPQPDSDAVRNRQQQAADQLASQSGTLSTIKTDLVPSDLVGKRRVLLGV